MLGRGTQDTLLLFITFLMTGFVGLHDHQGVVLLIFNFGKSGCPMGHSRGCEIPQYMWGNVESGTVAFIR